MTECSQSSLEFEGCGRREVVASFDGGTISSDGGSLLLRQTDQRLNLLPRLAACFVDRRDPERVEHSVVEMLSQRIYGLALGYEDVNDHEDLRMDPLFGLLAVELGVYIGTGATLTLGLALVFFVISMYFVYRSFYGMRIES